MKVTVRDAEILKCVEPQKLRDYLFSSGWHEDRPFLDNATIWLKQVPLRGEFEILLPMQQSLGDYAARISDAIKTLEEVENRSQIDILSELISNFPNMTIQGLVTQIKTPDVEKLSGEITLQGVVFDKLRKIKTQLNERDYISAIKAYQERLPVIFTGDLIKENNTLILKHPRNFQCCLEAE
jgi:molybdopterin converting factor small subunit